MEKRKPSFLHSFIPSFLHSPPPPPSFLFFCSRPNFLDELARKRLLRRLVEIRHFNVLASAANTTSIDYGQSLSFFFTVCSLRQTMIIFV